MQYRLGFCYKRPTTNIRQQVCATLADMNVQYHGWVMTEWWIHHGGVATEWWIHHGGVTTERWIHHGGVATEWWVQHCAMVTDLLIYPGGVVTDCEYTDHRGSSLSLCRGSINSKQGEHWAFTGGPEMPIRRFIQLKMPYIKWYIDQYYTEIMGL